MIRSPVPRVVPLVLALPVALAATSCKRSNGPVPDPSASAAASSSIVPSTSGMHRVLIDPDLVASGRIQTRPAEKRALTDETQATGEVVPAVDGEAQVGALVPGRVASILVKEGDHVKAGQVLAMIDAPEAARMQGEWLRAQARLWRAEKLVEQERALWSEKATSERALQAAESEVREAQAAERSARDLMASSRVPMPKEGSKGGAARIAITTPITGVISRRSAILGGHVAAEVSLFEIVAPDKLLVKANVPEVVAQRVEVGSPAIIKPRGAEQTCPGTVESRLDKIDEIRRTMGVMVKVNPGCSNLLAGSFAEVTVRLSASGAASMVVVPRSAIVESDGAPTVFVADPSAGPGTFLIKVVRLGLTDGVNTVVEDGIRENDMVVVVGALLLKGEHIRKDLQ